MPDTPLNPDALEAATRAVSLAEREMHTNESLGKQRHIARRAASAYLAAALPEVTQSEELSILIGDVKTAIDHEHIDPREFIDLNDVLWALEAQATPEVTSVEELDQLPVESVVRDSAGIVYENDLFDQTQDYKWARMASGGNYPTRAIILPARVLYRPSEQP